ncbi:response regulator [Aerosakkonemataceae cyanobacterium BLCC-F154]|uniref:histidine kinase n=1 Tax=Floridaenema fluviatile BLCC-F154 TaxID=3153640 RepID=A0ABV4YHQ2_9CYAN
MFIDDEELRTIFKSASEEHLQKLEDGLLHLEKNPHEQTNLEELMREAHSLKGDAGMLGLKDISTLAHQLEHILGTVKRGEVELSSEISDRLYQGLDAISQLVVEAVIGTPPSIDAFHVLAYMMGGNNLKSPANSTENNQTSESEIATETSEKVSLFEPQVSENLPDLESIITATEVEVIHPEVEEPLTVNIPNLTSEAAIKEIKKVNVTISPISENSPEPLKDSTNKTPNEQTYRIESVRVETRHLDSLMTQAGELTVTKIRINHRLSEIEEISNVCEECSRIRTQSSNKITAKIDSAQNAFFPVAASLFSLPQSSDLSLRKDSSKSIEKFLEQLETLVKKLRNSLYEDVQRLEVISDELSDGIRTLRLLPLATIFNLFPRMVRDLAKQQGKEINFIVEGGETKADKRIIEEMKDPLMHMIRNCVDHGIETVEERSRLGKPTEGRILLRAKQTTTNVVIEVIDDGRGLDIEKIKQTALKRRVCREEELATMTPSQVQSLIFTPGFSTRTFVTEVSGRGVGLDVVRTNVEHLKGNIQVESNFGMGCTIRMLLPTTLATAHVLIVSVDNISYAIPVEYVMMARLIAQEDIFPIEGQDTILVDYQPISVTHLADLLEINHQQGWGTLPLQQATANSQHLPCIIIKVGDATLGLIVDALLDEQDVMLKPQGKLLKRVRNVSGATILGTGEVCMVLNPQDLIKSVRKQAVSKVARRSVKSLPSVERKQAILLVEDSIAIRTQEKRILEGAGYEVVTAVDGMDALSKLKSRSYDAIVSDIQMPNLDGLSLTAKIRQHKEYSEIPIILVTSLASDEDKKRGAEAGANAYITKGTFNQQVLLDTLRRLV